MRSFALPAALAALLAMALAGCSAAPGPTRQQLARIDSILATAPGAAQPSTIVATEIAFARMAREEGQWTAFRRFAAADALLHGETGPFAAQGWLATQDDPERAVQWAPRSVWVSCDASLALSMGRYRYPAGNVGSYVTVWEWQPDGTYRWVYDGGADDDPQPPPAAPDDSGEDAIVVTALDSVRGEVADCATPPAQPAFAASAGARSGGGASRDGTLAWRWEQTASGARRFSSTILRDGRWEEAGSFDYARPGGS